MPAYQEPFGAVGQAVGGAAGGAGGGLLGALGHLLEPLDYPRQALWNLARGAGNALSGEGTWDDALRAVPGALGGLLTGGLMATGAGAPLGILAGSALGGAAQGVGKATGREAFDAPTAEDVTGSDDFLPNFLLSSIADPLTYAGGIGGAKKGAQAGRSAGQAVGRDLEQAALARGPRYPGGVEKLDALMNDPKVMGMPFEQMGDLLGHLVHARANPGLLGEIPQGSTYLGHGRESVGLQRPDGGVTLIQRPSPWIKENIEGMQGIDLGAVPPARPDLPEVLQAARSRGFEGANPVRVEQVPYLDVMHPGEMRGNPAARAEFHERGAQAKLLSHEMKERGLNFWDAHGGNVGYDAQGRLLITDPGAVSNEALLMDELGRYHIDPAGGGILTAEVSRAAEAPRAQPGMVQNLLLKMLGSDQAVQREIAEALARQNLPGAGRRALPRAAGPSIPSVVGSDVATVRV